MKQFATSFALFVSFVGIACDNCNVYLSFSPTDYKNSISLFSRQRELFGAYNQIGEMIATKHTGHNEPAFWGKKVTETYQTAELRGSFYIRDKWKTTIILPYVHNNQSIENTTRYDLHGFGDPIVLQSYQLYSTKKDTTNQPFYQRLLIGGGIKFPLGKTTRMFENGKPNLDLQPGSGSWDLISFAAYTFKYKFLGMENNVNFKWNGKDVFQYKYGNTLNATSSLFAQVEFKVVTLRAYSGLYFEKAQMDETHYYFDEPPMIHGDTGGNVLFANYGVKVFLDKFTIFGEYQDNIHSKLNGYTQLLTRNRINLGLTYNF